MFKKISVMTLGVIMAVSLAACGNKETTSDTTANKATTVAATVSNSNSGDFAGVSEDTADHYTYENTEGGVKITRYENSSYKGAVIIPQKINGMDVVEIAKTAFGAKTSITAIKIPDSVKVIGENAFVACLSLKTVVIGDGVQTIGKGAFGSNAALVSVTFGKNVQTISDMAFTSCTSIKELALPDSLQSIGAGAFTGCSAITSVNIPENVKTIGSQAFYYMNSVKEMKFPANVTIESDDSVSNNEAVYKVKAGSSAEEKLKKLQESYGSSAKFTIQTY